MKKSMALVHPGEILKLELIDGHGLTISKTAELLGVTRANLSNVLNGKAAISPNMALRVEMVFGGNARLWASLQSSYDLNIAKKAFLSNPPQLKLLKTA